MTEIAIQAQVDAIKKVTREALKTKKSALQFLIDAGIVPKESNKARGLKTQKRNR